MVAQLAVAFASAHGLPQAPQLSSSLSSDSHPSAATALQSPVPETQRNVHAALMHTGVEFGRLRHEFPQLPQWRTLVAKSASQPSPGTMLQLPNPGSHAPSTHAELSQLVIACARRQSTRHAPQLVTEILVSTSHPLRATPSQFAKPAEQAP